MYQLQGRSDDRVAMGSVPDRRVDVGLGEAGAEDGDQEEIQKPVEYEILALSVPHGRFVEEGHHRGFGVSGPGHDQKRG